MKGEFTNASVIGAETLHTLPEKHGLHIPEFTRCHGGTVHVKQSGRRVPDVKDSCRAAEAAVMLIC